MSDIDTQAPQADPVATDTSTPVDTSEASTQVDEAPEATQAPQEATEVKAEDTVEEKLYAGKYKSPEEMEKAYKELESKFGQTTSEKAELAKILNDAFIAPEPQAQPVQTDTDNYYQEESKVDPTMAKLQQDVAVTKFIFAHSDADAASMKEVLQSDPMISQITGHEAKLEYAYLRSQNMAKPKAIAEAQKKSAEATQAKIVEKQTAQVETASKAESTDENSELMNRITSKGSTQAESDAARREYIRKNLINL